MKGMWGWENEVKQEDAYTGIEIDDILIWTSLIHHGDIKFTGRRIRIKSMLVAYTTHDSDRLYWKSHYSACS